MKIYYVHVDQKGRHSVGREANEMTIATIKKGDGWEKRYKFVTVENWKQYYKERPTWLPAELPVEKPAEKPAVKIVTKTIEAQTPVEKTVETPVENKKEAKL